MIIGNTVESNKLKVPKLANLLILSTSFVDFPIRDPVEFFSKNLSDCFKNFDIRISRAL